MKVILRKEKEIPDIGQTYIITHIHLVGEELMLVMERVDLQAGIEINKEALDEYMEKEK